MDVVQVFDDVHSSIEDMQEIRKMINKNLSVIYVQAVRMATKLNFQFYIATFSETSAS